MDELQYVNMEVVLYLLSSPLIIVGLGVGRKKERRQNSQDQEFFL
jgi:hypothetical protein